MLTEMSKEATEVIETVRENSRVGWKDLTKERKKSSCSWENEIAPIHLSI